MTAKYFEKFPLLYYPYDNDQNFKLATDILRRVKFTQKTKRSRQGTIPYTIQDGDTPENVAARFYGASNLHWVVLLINDMVNPYYDWPLSVRNLEKFITRKYGEGFENDTKHVQLLNSGIIVDIPDALLLENGEPLLIDEGPLSGEQLLIFDGQEFNEPLALITNRQFEIQKNEERREIVLLRPQFVNQAIAQLTQTIGS